MTGKRPIGYRAPSWKYSGWTMGQVKAAGFLYDSSLMASDDAYELLLDGKPTGVVELPIERILDDSPYFGGNADGSNPSVGDVLRSLPVGVRCRVRRRRTLPADDASAHDRPSIARRACSSG